MLRSIKPVLGLVGVVLTSAAFSQSAVAQSAVDPKLAEAWKFMQANMPGVPYKLLEDACKEGTVTVYNGTWGEAQRMANDAFKKRFSCMNVVAFEIATGPRRERFLAESRAGRHSVDIVQDTDPGALNEQSDDGLLMKYAISNENFFDDAVKKAGFWYPLRIAVNVNAWNTDKVTPEEIKILQKWDGVTNPVFKGRVGISLPSGGGATFLPFYVLQKLYGDEFMQKFAALQPRVFENLNLMGSALASGDVDVLLAMSETPLNPLYVAGAPIQWSLPLPGIGPATGQAISANAPHPNAAKLFQEYSFTEEGYGAWQKLGGPPARKGFVDQRDVAKEKWYVYPTEFYKYDPAEVTKAVTPFMVQFNAWFKGK